jgi:hypothetical protein
LYGRNKKLDLEESRKQRGFVACENKAFLNLRHRWSVIGSFSRDKASREGFSRQNINKMEDGCSRQPLLTKKKYIYTLTEDIQGVENLTNK